MLYFIYGIYDSLLLHHIEHTDDNSDNAKSVEASSSSSSFEVADNYGNTVVDDDDSPQMEFSTTTKRQIDGLEAKEEHIHMVINSIRYDFDALEQQAAETTSKELFASSENVVVKRQLSSPPAANVSTTTARPSTSTESRSNIQTYIHMTTCIWKPNTSFGSAIYVNR
jgi:hypothetical protein